MDTNTTMNTYELLTGFGTLVIAIANSIMLIVVILGYRQWMTSKQALEDDHERSRRQMTLDLFKHWNTNLRKEGTIARKLVENFTEEQCKKLKNQEPFQLDSKYIDLLKGSLDHFLEDDRRKELDEAQDKNNEITVNQQESGELRWAVIAYLNTLETVLAGWNHNMCHREMVFEQFQYLVSPENNIYILGNFRKVMGNGHTYPNIYAFVGEIKTRQKTAANSSVLGKS